jgi:MFS family permease
MHPGCRRRRNHYLVTGCPNLANHASSTLTSPTQVIFADIIPLRQRPKYFSVVLGAWAVGSVLGPFIGGLFVEKATWRACFYLNFPFCALGLPLVFFLIPLKTIKTSLKAKLLRVDWLGGLIFIGGLTATLIAVTWGGVQFAWTSPRTLIPLSVGASALIANLVWERYGALEPFLRQSLLHTPSAIAAYLCAFLQGLLLFTALYYIPFFLAAVLDRSPLESGIDLFPATCLILPGSAIVSLLITRSGHFRFYMWGGWAVSTVGTGLLLHLDSHTKTWYWALVFGIFGLGMGMVLSSVNFATQANAKVRDAGRAAAMYAFCRSLGMAVGVAVSGGVFQNLMAGKLGHLGLETDIARNAESYVAVLRGLEVTNPSAAAYVLTAYLKGFWGVFVLMLGLSGLGLLMSLCVKHREMDKRLDSQYTLDRSSRSSRFLDSTQVSQRTSRILSGEVRPASDATLLGTDDFIANSNRQSRVVFNDQRPMTAQGERIAQPEAAVVHVSRSPDGMEENLSSRPLTEEVLWDGRASQCHGAGPIWGVS